MYWDYRCDHAASSHHITTVVPINLLVKAEWHIHASVGHTIIGSHNGLSPDRHQPIIRTNAAILSNRPQGKYLSEILFKIQKFSFMEMRLKMSSAKYRPFCLGLIVLSGKTSGSVFCLLLGVSSDYAQPITGQVTEVTCPVIGRAQPELTPSKRQKAGPDHEISPSVVVTRCWIKHCDLKSDGRVDSIITETPIKYQNDWQISKLLILGLGSVEARL